MDVRDEITTIQKALVNYLSLAYKFRYPSVATPNDLRLITSQDTNTPEASVGFCVDQGLIFVTTVGRVYKYEGYSLEIDDNLNVIIPNDMPIGGRGRWIKQDLALDKGPNYRKPVYIVQTGYAKAVEPYEGQLNIPNEELRAMGVIPGFFVHWAGDEYETASQYQGSVYFVKHRFVIQCLSSCLRPDASALYGSPFQSENDYDPGLYRMMGDVRYLLAGSKIGVSTVDYTDLKAGDVVEEDWDSRIFIGEVEVIVRDTVNIADEDLVDFRELAIIPHLTESKGDIFNLSSYILQGLRVPILSGLSVAPESGSVLMNDNIVYSNPTVYNFPANSITYRDLDINGNFIYSSISSGEDPPIQPPNTMRIGLSITDSSNITFDNYLADSNVPYGSPYIIKEN